MHARSLVRQRWFLDHNAKRPWDRLLFLPVCMGVKAGVGSGGEFVGKASRRGGSCWNFRRTEATFLCVS